MSTYGDMQDRIADELVRSDLTTQIQRAILSALQFYRGKAFRWNQVRATTTLTEGVEYYGLPSDFVDFGTAVLIDGTSKERLQERAYSWIDDNLASTNNRGRPYVIAVQSDQFRLYPTPNNSTYQVLLTYTYELSPPADRASTSAWFTDGEELIRLHAKVDMLQNVIRGQESLVEASALQGREAALYATLRDEFKRSLSSGRIQSD